MMWLIRKLFEWFVVIVIGNFVLYILVVKLCLLGPDFTQPPPIDPTGTDPDAWGDLFKNMALGAAITLGIILVGLWAVSMTRRGAIMMAKRLITMHENAGKDVYHKVWLKKKIVMLWQRANPKDKKKEVASIAKVIRAGYGLMPDEMPKPPRKTKTELKPEPTHERFVPRLVSSNEDLAA